VRVVVVVSIQRRRLPEAQLRALEEEARATAPSSVRRNFTERLYWPERQLRRRLAGSSPRRASGQLGESEEEQVEDETYSRAPRDWPVAPNKPSWVEELDQDWARLAQHLWMNGQSVKTIATRMHSSPKVTLAYLASRAYLKAEQRRLSIQASLKNTVLEALPADRAYPVAVKISQQQSADVVIDTELSGPRSQQAWVRH
jgi:hypothetical protein